jgi:hypothetical protein
MTRLCRRIISASFAKYQKSRSKATITYQRLLHKITSGILVHVDETQVKLQMMRGLQQKYLKQHETDVAQFFQFLDEQSFSTDAAESLRGRLTRNQNKLFTFINYDGVPWNNNNAEHAIKQFAYYRENTAGMLRESGLSDYLALLSICQTCQYKGVSFLKFLLSKEQDVDEFNQRKPQTQQLASIELYPEGFVPPHFASKHKKQSLQEPASTEVLEPDETDMSSGEPL